MAGRGRVGSGRCAGVGGRRGGGGGRCAGARGAARGRLVRAGGQGVAGGRGRAGGSRAGRGALRGLGAGWGRLSLAGGALAVLVDQPFVSRFTLPPFHGGRRTGAAFRFMDRAGMATAREELPEKPLDGACQKEPNDIGANSMRRKAPGRQPAVLRHGV